MFKQKWQNTKPPKGVLLNGDHPLAKGLVGAWLMNEGSGNKVFDFSGYNGSKATLNGNAVWVAGNRGWAIDFSAGGSDFIKINPALGFGTSGTLVWSVVLDTIVTYGGHIAAKDSSAANCIFIYSTASSTVRVLHYNTANAIVIDINMAVSTNKWMTIAYTWSPVAGRLYINGVLKVEDTTIADTLRIPSEIWIGSYSGTANRGLDGRISYVYGYNCVLSAAGVAWLYREPFAMFDKARLWAVAGAGNIKKIAGVSWASVKKVSGVAVASIKKIAGVAAS